MTSIAGAWRGLAAMSLLLALIAFGAPSSRADQVQIAQIKTASGAAFVLRDGNRMAAKPGDPLFEKDALQTDADGAIGVTFTDNTVLSVGPKSDVALAQYAFDSSNFTGSMLTDIRAGTLTMTSGDIARSSPEAMKVRTPHAILGVRGTTFAVEVGDR